MTTTLGTPWQGVLLKVGEVTPGAFTLTGRVTDANTGKAIASGSITLDTKQATTNQDGNYSFANLEAKTYHIVFVKQGYTTLTKNIAISKDTVLNIQMTSVGVPPGEKAFPWWLLGVAGGAAAIVAIAAASKRRRK